MKHLTLIRKLNNIKRCCLYPLANPTSVAEHSFHVAVIALFIVEDLKKIGRDVDEAAIIRHALMHDVEEAIISDIPYTVKVHIKDSLDTALKIMQEDQAPDLPAWVTKEIHAKCDGSPEWLITKAADMIELLLYCHHERSMGNANLMDMYDRGYEVLVGLAVRINSPWLDSVVADLEWNTK